MQTRIERAPQEALVDIGRVVAAIEQVALAEQRRHLAAVAGEVRLRLESGERRENVRVVLVHAAGTSPAVRIARSMRRQEGVRGPDELLSCHAPVLPSAQAPGKRARQARERGRFAGIARGGGFSPQ